MNNLHIVEVSFYNSNMNQTKKLTQGAMMLAIVGALILIDRMTAYWFTELITLMMPVVIIMYSAMHSFRDGILLSVGLAIISFLLGNFQIVYLIYVPVGILTGLAYSYGVGRNFDKRTLMLTAIAVYVIGEILATFVVYPLLGFPLSTMIEEYRLAMEKSGSIVGFDYAAAFKMAGIDFNQLLVIVYIISTVVMGAMEGILIHLISVFMLKRFKIRDLGSISIWDMKPSKVLSYVCMLLVSTIFLARGIENQFLYYTCMIVSILSGIVLLYYGYLFVVLYGVIVLHRNIGGFIVIAALFLPGLLIALMILGFLYGSGPLRDYLERKRQVKV